MVLHFLPQCLAVHAVERFLIVDEIDIEMGLFLQQLYNGDAKIGYLVIK